MEKLDRKLVNSLVSGKLSRREFIVRAVSAGVAVTGIAQVLAACAPATEPPKPTTAPAAGTTPSTKVSVASGKKLTMKLRAAFIPQGNEILKAMVFEWGTKNGIPVECDIVSMNDLQTITATASETGAGPDIIEINQGSAHLFAEKLVDVSDVAQDLAARYGGYYPAAEEACKVGGAWKSVPRFFAPHAINYRTDVFEAAGYKVPPKTWEELYQAGKAIKAANLPPIAFPLGHAVGDGNDFCYSVLWSFGASDVAADGKTVKIDSPETRAALEYMKKLKTDCMPAEVLSYDDAANNRSFAAGAISCTNNASTIWGNAFNQATKIKVGTEEKLLHELTSHFAYPAGPAGTVLYAEFMSSAIFSYSPNIEAAKALLKYLNEETQVTPWALPNMGFVFPPLKAYQDKAIMPWNTNPKLEPFKVYAQNAHLPGYPSTNFRGGTDAYAKWLVVDMFASVCLGATPIDKAIATAKEQLVKIYGG